jgi:hypothetical protein
MSEPPLERHPWARVDNAPIERSQPSAVRDHDPVPGIGGARVYAENNH